MKNKVTLLVKKIHQCGYDKLKYTDYREIGFSNDDADKLKNVYYAIIEMISAESDYKIFLEEILKHTEDKKVFLYFKLYIAMGSKSKDRKRVIEKLIDILIEHKANILNFKERNIFEECIIKTILKYSTQMNIRLKEVMGLVYEYIESINNCHVFLETVSHALRKINDEELEKKFKDIFLKLIREHAENREINILKNIKDKIEKKKIKFININTVLEITSNLAFRLGNEDGGSERILHLSIAIDGFSKLGNIQMQRKSLSILERIIQNNEIALKPLEYVQYDKEIKELIQLVENLQQLFFAKYSVEDLISISNKEMRVYEKTVRKKNTNGIQVYYPYPMYEHIEDLSKEETLANLVTNVLLGKNRVIRQGKNNSSIKNSMYKSHMSINVFPFMNHLDKWNVIFIKNIRKLMNASRVISEKTQKYYYKIERYYSHETSFEFVHFASILLEMIMRDIYKHLNGASIVTQKKSITSQFSINLQEILKENMIKEFFKKSFYKYIEYIMVDDEGLNLRNNLLHGLIEFENINHRHSQILMHLILVILNNTNEKMENESMHN